MAVMKKTEIVLDHRFDSKSCRHTMNGKTSVLHCHHYATLYCQLADDCGMLDGKKLMAECAEDVFFDVLAAYYDEHDVNDLADRLAIGEQYYAAAGMGQMEVQCAGRESGEVELIHSHVDEGWLKKWGQRDKAVNCITAGYIAAMFAAAFDLPPRSYSVNEVASIVSGAESSKFDIVANE